jgi:1,4-dihydroxy-6-naphthoate synthase
MSLSLGFSPCPNDTFIFHDLVHGLVADCPDFTEPVLADVETLNLRALQAKLDVTKISFHALGHVLDDYVLLDAGSALGRGCGPLLVTGREKINLPLEKMSVAIPGRYTTAALLLRLFAPACLNTTVLDFAEIMPAVSTGRFDAGVIIHESRFTYQQYGLVCRQDLGSWWEEVTGHPIPLGGIAARRSLGSDLLCRIEESIRNSVRQAFAEPERSMNYIRQHAQEMDEDIIRNHINLYVNNFSQNLGQSGLAAIRKFITLGIDNKIFDPAVAKIDRLILDRQRV